MNPTQRAALKVLLEQSKREIQENPCDHSVGICVCPLIGAIETLEPLTQDRRATPKHDPACASAIVSRYGRREEFSAKEFWAWVADDQYAPAKMLQALQALKFMGRIVHVRGKTMSTVYKIVKGGA